MSKPVPAAYQNVYGLWRVTTEGDCEGRSIKDLGVHEGFIDDIAFNLADQCYYTLKFDATSFSAEKTIPSLRKEVNVALGVESQTWDCTSEERAVQASALFRDRPVRVRKGPYYASFVLVREVSKEVKEKIQEAIRKDALAKLTHDERVALGLEYE